MHARIFSGSRLSPAALSRDSGCAARMRPSGVSGRVHVGGGGEGRGWRRRGGQGRDGGRGHGDEEGEGAGGIEGGAGAGVAAGPGVGNRGEDKTGRERNSIELVARV